MTRQVLLALILLINSSVVMAADATVVPPNPITNTTVQSPNSTVLAPTVDPATVAACPATISDCPDINGQGGNPATCPDNCTATRTVTPNPAYSPSVDGFIPPVLKVKAPACPVGYFDGQQFNDQPEYAYMSPPARSPVTQAAYDLLGNSYCSPTGPSTLTYGVPAGCGLTAGQACCNYGNPCSSKVNNGIGYTGSTACPTGKSSMDSDAAVFFITGQTYSWTNCAGSCAAGCLQGTWLSTDNYNYTITKAVCTPKPGLYPTGNSTEASVLCTRSKTQWKKLNQ